MAGNTLGRLFAVTTFGESHGPAIGCVIDGCPPGMALDVADIQPELNRTLVGCLSQKGINIASRFFLLY